jgi:Winged helix-turn helix
VSPAAAEARGDHATSRRRDDEPPSRRVEPPSTAHTSTPTAQALALGARIVLECTKGDSNIEVAQRLRVTMQTVGKWRARFVERRLDGLLDEPRPGTPRRLSDAKIEEVVVKTSTRSLGFVCVLPERDTSHGILHDLPRARAGGLSGARPACTGWRPRRALSPLDGEAALRRRRIAVPGFTRERDARSLMETLQAGDEDLTRIAASGALR